MTNYKVLGQAAPAATTWADLYTVGSGKEAVVSTINVCNRGTATSFRIAVRPAGAALENKNYIAYDVALDAGDAIPLTIGMSLSATDVVSVYAGSADVSFNLFGGEITV